MKSALWLVLGAGALWAFSRRSEQATKQEEIPVSPTKRRKPKVTTIEPIDIYGRVPGSELTPLTVIFEIALSGVEKFAVSPQDIKQAVVANAHVLPGIGRPDVLVSEIPRGYVIYAKYLDSVRPVSKSEVKQAIESIDSRLKGRVQNIIVRQP